jgi:hypothetical protein
MIRLWQQKDVIQLRHLIKAFLENQAKYGSRILPSENNIRYYLQVGYFQIEEGDPHLVFEEDGKILGFIQLGRVLTQLEIRGKTAELFTMYTIPEARGRFINIQLIRDMGIMAVNRGYTHIYSSILCGNSKALKNVFHNPAIWPTSVYCEWDLSADVQFQDGELLKVLDKRSA